jgi:Flp pilus assembly protein TadG
VKSARDHEHGSALVEFSWLAILLLVPLLWGVLAVFEVQRAAFGVTAAARAAGRAYVLAPSDGAGQRQARAVASQVLADHGIGSQQFSVLVKCESATAGCHSGGAVVQVRVESSVAVPWVPVIGGREPAVALAATHVLPIGEFQE